MWTFLVGLITDDNDSLEDACLRYAGTFLVSRGTVYAPFEEAKRVYTFFALRETPRFRMSEGNKYQ